MILRIFALGSLATFVLASSLSAGQAQVTLFGASRISQPWLALDADARAAGLGEAVVVMAEGNAALQSNPAGLNSIIEPELSFAHNEWNSALGMREERLGYGRRVGEGALGVGLRYFSFGSFENRNAAGALIDTTQDSAYAGSLGYAQGYWADTVQLGGALSVSQETLGTYSSNLYSGSVGAMYQGPWGLRLGAAANGIKAGGDATGNAPTQTRLGLGWASARRGLQLASEWARPTDGDGVLRLGAEASFLGTYTVRTGWRMAQGEGSALDSGLSFGAGLRMGDLRIDYAYVPLGEMSRTHRIGATLYLSDSLFGSKIIIEAGGNSATAELEYKDGMAAFDKKDWYEAKVALKHVLKVMPSFGKAPEVNATLAEIEKRIQADKAKGGSRELRTVFAKKIQEAKDLYKGGEFLSARKKLEEIFNYDPNLKDALDLQKTLNEGVGKRVAALKQEAVSALQEGDLRTGVTRYRAVLRFDDEDQEAKTRLLKLRPRILQESKRMHREGIDAYVAGDLPKAIAVWQQALDLEPSDPHSIRRDMEKARKLLELRSSK